MRSRPLPRLRYEGATPGARAKRPSLSYSRGRRGAWRAIRCRRRRAVSWNGPSRWLWRRGPEAHSRPPGRATAGHAFLSLGWARWKGHAKVRWPRREVAKWQRRAGQSTSVACDGGAGRVPARRGAGEGLVVLQRREVGRQVLEDVQHVPVRRAVTRSRCGEVPIAGLSTSACRCAVPGGWAPGPWSSDPLASSASRCGCRAFSLR